MNATVELHGGCLGSFLSNHLKTNQLEVNANAKNSSSVRLREPRDLFALPPKDRDNDYSQQAAKWPAECEVAIERVTHLWDAPKQPEPFYQPTGKEVKSRPVGEENGLVIFSYNPLSAVNYSNDVTSSGDDISESSNESRSPSPYYKSFSKCSSVDSAKNSNCEDIDEEQNELDKYLDNSPELEKVHYKSVSPQRVPSPKPVVHQNYSEPGTTTTTTTHDQVSSISDSIRNLNIVNTSMQFSRSCAGGSKYLSNVNPNSTVVDTTDLVFESRFESGNLAKAIKVTSTYYELYLRPDLYTNRSKQWFYFRVNNTKRQTVYRFAIVNLVKSDSLYNEGMKPLMYSKITAERSGEGWRRCGENICYYRNEDDNSGDEDDENGSYTLTFNIQFLHDRDTVYFAHSYPYTYSDLQDYLMEIQKNPVKSKYCKLRLLCRSIAGNNVYYLSVTAPSNDEDVAKKKKAVVVSARVHPGETPSSWIMKGFMDFITGDSNAAKRLRHKFIFKLIPMLNPDGVIVGNTRNSLTGKDLNRQYRTVIKDNYPSIWYTKQMIKRLMEDCGVAMYCDMHAHSRKHNIFIYGCENRRSTEKKLTEQVFPLMVHKNAADKFCFESCKFKVQRNKEGTGRIVVWMLGVTNSYTLEASFGGSTLGSRNKSHFTIADYETMGRTFCETLLDYYDDNPIKEQLRIKIIERLTKQGSTADDPLNIALSDYSSDEGDSISNSSDNEGKDEMSELEGPCCQPLKVPPSSPVSDLIKLLKDNRKHKKSKPKCKSSNLHKRNKIQRTPLELPTTDPGSDIQFSTDDELYIDGYGTIPKTQKSHMQLEFQRKYISTQQMPPELIVTAAKNKSHDIIITANKEKKVSSPVITEFPHIPLATRRTNSWHNLNKSSPTKIKTPGVNILRGPENDSLQFKLSLKKQVWTGVMGPGVDRTRPLSWGMPPIGKKKNLQKHDENQALLEACCQKLEEWQENELYSYPENKNKVTINLVAPDHLEKSFRTKKSATYSKSSKIQTNENKTLKKRNPLSKLAETTQMLTRLTNSRAKISLHNRKNVKSDYFNSPASGNGSAMAPILTPISKAHKFKAGGIVASVQPLKKKKNRSIQSIKDNTNTLEIDKSFVKKPKTKSKKKKK